MTPQNISYTANGTCAVFDFAFPVFEPMELEVLIDGTLQTSGFVIRGDGANSGGAVVFAAAPVSGKTITLRRAGKIQVSDSDAPGFLADKIVAGNNVTVTQTSDANGQHLTIAAAANPADFLLKSQNLADLPNTATARSNLGLGTAATLAVDTDGTLTADSDSLVPSEKAVKTYVDSQIAAIPPLPSYRNLLIGGDASTNPWQRGNSLSVAGASQAYTADRWLAWGAGSSAALTVSKQTSGITGFPFCFRLQRTAENTDTGVLGLVQVVESINVVPYQGKTLTLSFQARSGADFSAASNALTVSIMTGTGSDEGSAAVIAGTWSGQVDSTATKTLSTSLQTFTTSVTVPVNAAELAVSFSYAPTGTAGAADYLEIACVELDAYGATSFEVLPEDVVLARCQRYFLSDRTSSRAGVVGPVSGQIFFTADYPVTLRTYPIVTYHAQTSGTVGYVRDDANTDERALSAVYLSTRGHQFVTTNVLFEHNYRGNYTVDAEFY